MLVPMLLFPASCVRDVPAAAVLRIDSFGPAAGNGLGPRAGALDVRGRRSFTLNFATRSISVVDLKRRVVTAVIPLGDRWTPESRSRILFDPVTARVFVASPVLPGIRGSRILAVSPRSLRVVAERETEDTLIANVVLLPKRHELVTSAWRMGHGGGWGIEVFDTRTLAAVHRFELPSEIVAMAADSDRGILYTAEPDTPFNNGLGTMGLWGYGSARIVARSPESGEPMGRSEKLTCPAAILVDARRNRLLIPYSDQNRIAGSSDLVAEMDGHTLAVRRRFSFRSPAVMEGRRLAFDSPALDDARNALTADLTLQRQSALLDLRSGGVRLGPVWRDETGYPGPVDSFAGVRMRFVDNVVAAVSLNTLRELWRAPIGAEVRAVFAWTGKGRALAVVSRESATLEWAGQCRAPRAIRVRDFGGFDAIIAVDFARGWIYYTLPTINGTGGYLARADFRGVPDRPFSTPMPARLNHLAVARDGVRTYRGFVDFNSEDAAWVGVYRGDVLERKIVVPGNPLRLAYAVKADRLFLVYRDRIQTLEGASIPLSRALSITERSLPADASPDGKRLCLADAGTNLLSTIRTDNGETLAQRRLPFRPTYLAVDWSAGIAYVADGAGGQVVTVRLPQ